MRDGRILRFAEADTAVARLYCSVLLTQLSPQGAGRIIEARRAGGTASPPMGFNYDRKKCTEPNAA